MEDEFTILAPRRRVIRPGEESPARAQWAELLWNDPAQARAAALTQRLLYWRRRESDLTEAILKVQSDGRRARTRYSDELGPMYENLGEVRRVLRAVEGELASIGVTLASPASQPTTGSAGRPRRRRRRVVSAQGRARRRRAVAAAG
jgi:hypothetical protein